MVTIMSGVAYVFRHSWEFYSAELTVLAAVLLTTLVLVHLKLVDVGWPLVVAVLIVILVIIIVHIQKTTETSENHHQKIPLEPGDSSQDIETSVLKPHPPPHLEQPGSPLDPAPPIPEPAPVSTEHPVPEPSTGDTEEDISIEPDAPEPEIEEVFEPPPVKYHGVPIVHSPVLKTHVVLGPRPPSHAEHSGSYMNPAPSIPEPAPVDTKQSLPAGVPEPSPGDTEEDISFEPDGPEPEIEEVFEPLPVKYPGVPIAHSPDDAERVLTENGHKRRELETEYEGQVSDFLETVHVVPNECY